MPESNPPPGVAPKYAALYRRAIDLVRAGRLNLEVAREIVVCAGTVGKWVRLTPGIEAAGFSTWHRHRNRTVREPERDRVSRIYRRSKPDATKKEVAAAAGCSARKLGRLLAERGIFPDWHGRRPLRAAARRAEAKRGRARAREAERRRAVRAYRTSGEFASARAIAASAGLGVRKLCSLLAEASIFPDWKGRQEAAREKAKRRRPACPSCGARRARMDGCRGGRQAWSCGRCERRWADPPPPAPPPAESLVRGLEGWELIKGGGGLRALISRKGRRLVRLGTGHPRANKAGVQILARFLVMEALGRNLEQWEHVHHVNRDKLDDRIDNYQVLAAEDHGRFHSRSAQIRNVAIIAEWNAEEGRFVEYDPPRPLDDQDEDDTYSHYPSLAEIQAARAADSAAPA